MLVVPDELITAAQHLTDIQSDLGAASGTAARSTTRIAAAAQNEVSQSLASLFSAHGQQAHAAIDQTGLTGVRRFAHGIGSAADSYSSAESTNISSLFQEAITDVLLPIVEAYVLFIFLPLLIPFALVFVLGYAGIVLFGQLTGTTPMYGY